MRVEDYIKGESIVGRYSITEEKKSVMPYVITVIVIDALLAILLIDLGWLTDGIHSLLLYFAMVVLSVIAIFLRSRIMIGGGAQCILTDKSILFTKGSKKPYYKIALSEIKEVKAIECKETEDLTYVLYAIVTANGNQYKDIMVYDSEYGHAEFRYSLDQYLRDANVEIIETTFEAEEFNKDSMETDPDGLMIYEFNKLWKYYKQYPVAIIFLYHIKIFVTWVIEKTM